LASTYEPFSHAQGQEMGNEDLIAQATHLTALRL
jgi:hypothetical protein